MILAALLLALALVLLLEAAALLRASPIHPCPHGGAQRDGRCILDASHPELICIECGASLCPCGTCRAEHRERTGHRAVFAAVGAGDGPRSS